MPLSAVILFDEEDRAVAQTLLSILAENRMKAHMAATVADVRRAAIAVVIVSPAGARSPRLRALVEEAHRLRIRTVLLRLDQEPRVGVLGGILADLPWPTSFDAAFPPTYRSLGPLVEMLRELREPTRSPGGSYSIPDPDEPPIPKGPPSYDREAPLESSPPIPRGRDLRGAAAEPPPEIRDNVNFSAYAPPAVTPGARFLLSIWAYLEKDRKKVKERAGQGGRYREAGSKGPVKIARGTEVTVYLDVPGFEVDSPADTLAWEGQIGNCGFSLRAPEALGSGRYTGTARLLVAGVQVGRLVFEIEVGEQLRPETDLKATLEKVRTMFASYSSHDRTEVLRFQQGAEAAGVEVFVDVLSLRKGEDWPKRLEREVVSRDLFCLFWSKDASQSEWVGKEWRAAYAAKGVDYIHPVPLADPRDVPPPPELGSSKHFNDLAQIVIAYEELRKQE